MLLERYTKPEKGVPLRQDGHWSVEGIVAHWPFNDRGGLMARDLAGGNHGTLSGYATGQVSWTAGALNFPGVNETINCGTDDVLNITGDISILFVLKTSAAGTAGICQRYLNGGAFPGYEVNLSRSTAGKFDLYEGSWRENLNSTLVNDGKWHRVAIIGEGIVGKIYIDGVLDGTFTYSAPGNNPGDILYIGSTEDTASYFDGLLDQLSIYNRALNYAEARQLAINQNVVYEPEWLPDVAAAVGSPSPRAGVSGPLFGSLAGPIG